jgi:hypothetical protein
MSTPEPIRIDRRVAIKWMLTASAGAMLIRTPSASRGGGPGRRVRPGRPATGYGTDPDLVKGYKPGDLWPLTFTDAQRREAAALCDIIIPADDRLAQRVGRRRDGLHRRIRQRAVSGQRRDGKKIVDGLAWLDAESTRRFGAVFADATGRPAGLALRRTSRRGARESRAQGRRRLLQAVFRNLVASGFYTTPVGMKDIGYVGNVPLARNSRAPRPTSSRGSA